eukprot:CAMPEP_0202686698 /NCGR_PEP_ID=MMETSP1385-20130828/2456_1 /ASSEMBLY_ACC=CAM_ASM_000861 /TAXON_ID=933848 /ORGANISM="Elphidium margaritaceum" /LENGTH=255 /DNA_ID=CAMNT_0049341329 /DNA_START=138 /DNA_END=905 /DNA_ORIENTATION=-
MPFDPHVFVQHISEISLASILIVGGLVLSFFGNKLHKAILFFLGLVGGVFLTYFIINNVNIPEKAIVLHYALIIAFAVGIITGCITMCVYRTGIFVIGAIAGIIAAQCVWHIIMAWFPSVQYPAMYNMIVVAVLSLVFGCVGIKFIRALIKPFTAFVGSYMVISGSAYFVQKYVLKEDGTNVISVDQFFEAGNQCGLECKIFLGVWCLLFTICLLFQYGACSNSKVKSFPNVIETDDALSDEPRDDAEDKLLEDV